MRQFQIIILLLSVLLGVHTARSQYAFPPEMSTTIKTYADADVAKHIEVESVTYEGLHKEGESEGFKFQLKGRGIQPVIGKPVYVWYMLPGNELRCASSLQLPNLKADAEFTVDFIIQNLNKLTTPLPDNHIRLMPEKFDGFVLTYEVPTADTVDPKAKGKEINAGPDGETFTIVEVAAAFPGGLNGITTYLSKSIRYPEAAQQKNIQGLVIVSFTIDEEGKVTDSKVVKSVDESLDAEALRVAGSMPNWLPGRLSGKPVKSYFTLPITFKLHEYSLMSKDEKKQMKEAQKATKEAIKAEKKRQKEENKRKK